MIRTVSNIAPVVTKIPLDSMEEVKSKTENAVKEVYKVKIKNDEDLNKAALLITNVKKLQKFITQEKEKIIKPLREATSAARALFAPIEEQIEDAQRKLNREMSDYNDKKLAEIARKEESIAKRAETGQLKQETAIRKMEELPEVKSNVKVETGSVVFKKDKKVRVIDRMKVPDRFWVLDMVVLRSEALAISRSTGKLGEVIEGIEVYEETNTATKV